jgi:predicted AlkP superfamily phosphohydrolase/phosphomutase
VNLAGRDPHGIVAPGAAYEAVRDQIIAELSELTDPATGRRLVKKVWRREERFSGPYVERLPDLLVEAEYPDLFRPRVGRSKTCPYEPVRHLTMEEMQRRRITGCHRSEGIFLAYGEGIRAGTALPAVEITDVAPTALYLLGEPVPDWMDGRVLTEIMEPTTLETTGVVTMSMQAISGPAPEPPDVEDPRQGAERFEYGDEEARLVTARLKGLGYL